MEEAYFLLNECLHFVPSNSELHKEIVEVLIRRAEKEASDREWKSKPPDLGGFISPLRKTISE